MPPRKKSTPANRKKSTPTPTKEKKSTPESRQLDIEPIPVDQIDVELEIKGEELEAVEDTGNQQESVCDVSEAGEGEQAVVEEIKQEFRVLHTNSTVELKVKEELGEKEGDVVAVMGEGINTKIESILDVSGDAEEGGERMESVQSEGGNDKNDNAYVAEVTEKLEDAAEENGAADGQNERSDGDNGGTQLGIVPVAEQNSCDEGTSTAQIGDTDALGDNVNVLVMYESGNGRGEEVGGMDGTLASEKADKVDNEDEENPSVFINSHITERKKEKDLEIFIGNLDKGTIEDDLIKVFVKFGEIKSVRLVRNPTTNESRGFAFIQYATVEQAKNALSALKDGIQVGGKRVKMSVSQDNDTLYMSNICKLWTKEHVLETLKNYGIDNIEEIHLPNDPQKEGKVKGFALLEFSTHSDALAAFQRLRKPDAVFGRDRSAKVAFAQTSMHPNEEVLSRVKTVYVEGLTDVWNYEKIKENCRQYGEVVRIKLSRNLGTKRKDYGFVTFTSRESALACVEGINNACIGEGDVKVKASIAKPHVKGRLQKQGTRGGFKVTEVKEVPSSKEESERENKAISPKRSHAKSGKAKKKAKKKAKTVAEETEKKAKMVAEETENKAKTVAVKTEKKPKMVAQEKEKAHFEPEIGRGGKPNKPQAVTEDQLVRPSKKLVKKNRKNKNLHSKDEGRRKTGAKQGRNEMRSKRQMGNKRGRQSNDSRKPKRDAHIRKGSNYGTDSIKYRNPRGPIYDTSSVSYQSHAYATTVSGSKRPYAAMEPHAGYIEPVSRKQGRRSSGYVEPPVAIPPVRRQYQPLVGYQESAFVTQSLPQTVYHEPAVGQYSRPHAGYLAPALGTYDQPCTGYLEPAVVRPGRSHAVYSESAVPKYSHDPYMRRAGQQDVHASGLSAYGSGSSLPSSYAPSYTNYVGYEQQGGSSVSGGGAHLVRRTYY